MPEKTTEVIWDGVVGDRLKKKQLQTHFSFFSDSHVVL